MEDDNTNKKTLRIYLKLENSKQKLKIEGDDEIEASTEDLNVKKEELISSFTTDRTN